MSSAGGVKTSTEVSIQPFTRTGNAAVDDGRIYRLETTRQGRTVPMRTGVSWAYPSGCDSANTVVSAYNITGYLLWRHTTVVSWCYASGRVTTITKPVSTPKIGTVGGALGWSYGGVKSQTQTPNTSRSMYYTATVAEYKFCPPRVVCVQYDYPWSHIKSYYNGVGSVSSGK